MAAMLHPVQAQCQQPSRPPTPCACTCGSGACVVGIQVLPVLCVGTPPGPAPAFVHECDVVLPWG